MNVSYMIKNWTTKSVMAIVFGLCLGFVPDLMGQGPEQGDITSIEPADKNQKDTTIYAAGSSVEFIIRLGQMNKTSQKFQVQATGNPANSAPLGIRMGTGGIAYLVGTENPDGQNYRLDLRFKYIVQEGDLALPLTIKGSAGSDASGNGFEFVNTDLWKVREVSGASRDVVWRIVQDGSNPGRDTYDWNLSKARIGIQTLKFNEVSYSVPATERLICSIGRPGTDMSKPVPFYLWSKDRTIFSLEGEDADGKLALSIPSGAPSVSFTIIGNKPNSNSLLYLGQTKEIDPSRTNYVTRSVEVTAAPEPTIKVVIEGANSAGVLTTPESDTVSHTFYVQLTQKATSNMVVKLESDPNFIKLGAAEVAIAKDAMRSEPISFLALDNTPSVTDAVEIKPSAVTGVYKIFKSGKVIIVNADPEIMLPSPDKKTGVKTMEEYSIHYQINDVEKDQSKIKTTWTWGDGTKTEDVPGATGDITHKWTQAGTRTVTMEVKDSDGGTATRSFDVVITNPDPKPQISVVLNGNGAMDEGANNARTFYVTISEVYPAVEPTKVKLRMKFPDPAVTNLSNYQFSHGTEITIPNTDGGKSAEFTLTVVDGTILSGSAGIEIWAEPLDPDRANHYDSAHTVVMVRNSEPIPLRPLSSEFDAAYTNEVPAGEERKLPFRFTDPSAADVSTLVSKWDFGADGITDLVVTGAYGVVTNVFNEVGEIPVEIQLFDKDSEKPVTIQTVVKVGDQPSIWVEASNEWIPEIQYGPDNKTVVPHDEYVTVNLKPAVNYAVPVELIIEPADMNDTTGSISFPTTFVPVDANKMSARVRLSQIMDGTQRSFDHGFRITPRIKEGETGAEKAKNYFKIFSPIDIFIINEKPHFLYPIPKEGDEIWREVTQNQVSTFTWAVEDSGPDKNSTAHPMTVTWNWNDGTPASVMQKASGTVRHTFPTYGDYYVMLTATDKDGGTETITLKVSVGVGQTLYATPLGPNKNSRYHGLSYKGNSLGKGTIKSADAAGGIGEYINEVWRFAYAANKVTASLEAIPDPITNPEEEYNNFFYAWDDFSEGGEGGAGGKGGDKRGTLKALINPTTTDPICIYPLQPRSTGVTYQVRAVFSREWRILDNIGDLNQDGIPDNYKYWNELLTAGTRGDPKADVSLYATTDLSKSNPDGDVFPYFDKNGRITVSNQNCRAFSAIFELRGLYPGLNDWQVGRTDDGRTPTDGPLDEPGATSERQTFGTDPTKADTDGDTLPDGYEYYFWYCATVSKNFNPAAPEEEADMGNLLTGLAFNPNGPNRSIVIDANTIARAFNPLVTAETGQDTDNDGLTDLEEFLLETNPIQWDTDNDGIPDSWEVLMGTDPLDPDDRKLNENPDGDWMAYAVVKMQYVTVEIDGVTTNFFAEGAEAGTRNGKFWNCYTYNKEFKDLDKTKKADEILALGAEVNAGDIFPTEDIGVTAVEEKDVVLMHFQVYQKFGFDPRVAWGNDNFPGDVPTKPFTTYDEFMLCKFMANVVNKDGKVDPRKWAVMTTNPNTPDSDAQTINGRNYYDGMPDGWELYVGWVVDTKDPARSGFKISPWDSNDGIGLYGKVSADLDSDRLSNDREFGGSISSAAYSDPGCYNSSVSTNLHNFVSIYRDEKDKLWNNKFYPTDPQDKDTDGDSIMDGLEAATKLAYTGPDGTTRTVTWQYNTSVSNAVPYVIRGGGLNPCSMDTDRDGLPDPWEMAFTGTNAVSAATQNPYIEMGMDGTHGPANSKGKIDRSIGMGDAFSWTDPWVMGNSNDRREMDYDNDGLENYQEYMVQSLRHLRYDLSADAVPMTDFNPQILFTGIPKAWDNYKPGQKFLMPLAPGYGTTDPRSPDTDKDGLDDFYELFHGLNPILGAADLLATDDCGAFSNSFNEDPLIPLEMDFRKYPWLAGLSYADPDGDGLLNLEEAICLNVELPDASNTDPSPLWVTDMSYSNSWVNLYYRPFANFYWSPMPTDESFYMYSFEMNEGYDTDNDGLSDKNELITGSMSQSSPQDHDDPLRRQALWFSGNNSAAEAPWQEITDETMLRTFTVELWACPEVADREQVLIERPIIYPDSDLSTTGGTIRANFRLGISGDGRFYAMFQNGGVHDAQSAQMVACGPRVSTNVWTHLAATLNAKEGRFTIYVNGLPVQNVLTSLIPANGMTDITYLPIESGKPSTNSTDEAESKKYLYNYIGGCRVLPGRIVLGASDISQNPERSLPAWSDFTNFYQGYIDEVRVWDGWRTDAQILADYKKRFVKTDLLKNRSEIAVRKSFGASRQAIAENILPAELIYHYTFDNLFSAEAAGSVATAPRGFMDPSVQINRPEGYEVAWWAQMPTKSTVYTNYGYLPWIENGVAHLPNADGSVVDSRVFGLQYSGIEPVESDGVEIIWSFPLANNPYGFWYNNDVMDSRNVMNSKKGALIDPPDAPLILVKGITSALITGSDLLPMGDAWAKFTPVMWDDGSASGVWVETGTDSDSDGLPDWWENDVLGRQDLSWDDLDPNGSGMTVGHRYLRDIAKGMTASNHPNGPTDDPSKYIPQTSDADWDDLPDWWENLWGLKSNTAEGDNGKNGDPDKDGLSNYAEYQISEVYAFASLSPVQFKSDPNQLESDYFTRCGKSYLGAFFSDHDFMDDIWEDFYDVRAVNRNIYDAMTDFDDDGWSNWAECRFGISHRRTNPTLASRTGASVIESEGAGGGGEGSSNEGGATSDSLIGKVMEVPIPTLEVEVQYAGANKQGPLVIEAWRDPEMNGIPDARYTVNADGQEVAHRKNVGYWDSEVPIRVRLSPGEIVPGSVEFSFISQGTDKVGGGTLDENAIAGRKLVFAKDIVDLPKNTGTLFAMSGKKFRTDFKVGSIDYKTGKVNLDLSIMDGISYIGTETNATFYSKPKDSYIYVNYSSQYSEDYPKTVYLTEADPCGATSKSRGYIREGLNYIHAFIDLDNNGKWSVGEPYGVADKFGVDINWHSQKINIELTDLAKEQFRFDAAALARSEDVLGVGSGEGGEGGGEGGGGAAEGGAMLGNTTVRVVRRLVGSSTLYPRVVFDKTLTGGRTTITEADMLGQGQLGFDWGLAGVPATIVPDYMVYDVFVGNYPLTDIGRGVILPAYTFTNYLSSATVAPAATAVEPNGNYQYAARPAFKWVMEEQCMGFNLEIAKLVRGKLQTIWQSGDERAPIRTVDGVSVWRAPVSVGHLLTGNSTYQWRVAGLSVLYPRAQKWSDWKTFKMDAAQPPLSGGYGGIDLTVKYYGPLTAANMKGKVKVRAYLNAGFTGDPEGERLLSEDEVNSMIGDSQAINATLVGLTPSSHSDDYYVMAFIDQNDNGIRDPWESWGYANNFGERKMGYDPKPAAVTDYSNMPKMKIVIEDVDTDQDWYPDAWEYAKKPGKANFLELTEPNSSMIEDSEINPQLTTDEFTNTRIAAMAALFEVRDSALGPIILPMGKLPTTDSLNILSFSVSPDGTPTFEVRATSSGMGTLDTTATIKIVLEYKEKLDDPEWTVVGDYKNIPATGISQVKGTGSNKKTGFYRLRKIDE